MAATIELFEHGRTLHQSRPLRSDQIKQYEAIARAKYVQQVERKRIALEGWGQYLTHMDAQTRPVLRTRPSDSDISRALQEECAGSKQEQQLAVEADADVSRGIPNGILDVESGNEASDEEEADSEKADDSRGKGKALGVDGRDSVHGRDIKINTTSARARKKGKGKGPKKGKGLHRGRNRLALSPRPGEKSTDEDDVVPPKKSGSSAFSKQHSPVNTAKGPDLVLYPPYGHISRFSSSNTNITDNTASVAAEEVEMDGLNGRVSRMALEGDRERAHKDRSQSKGSTGKLSTTTVCKYQNLTLSKAMIMMRAGKLWHMEKLASLMTKMLRLQHLLRGEVHQLRRIEPDPLMTEGAPQISLHQSHHLRATQLLQQLWHLL